MAFQTMILASKLAAPPTIGVSASSVPDIKAEVPVKEAMRLHRLFGGLFGGHPRKARLNLRHEIWGRAWSYASLKAESRTSQSASAITKCLSLRMRVAARSRSSSDKVSSNYSAARISAASSLGMSGIVIDPDAPIISKSCDVTSCA